MPTIDFYLVSEPAVENCYSFICKLIDKAYQQQCSVYIHTNSTAETATLDDLLWIFRDDAFIPHSLAGPGSSPEKIQIGNDTKPEKINDVLINLTSKVPAFFNQFQRVLEIVPQNQKEYGRKKFRVYRDQECEITTHDLTKSE